MATAVLAYATFRMVGWTRKMAEAALDDVRTSADLVKTAGQQAEATREAAESAAQQVKLTREALDTQIRPVMVDVPRLGTVGRVEIEDAPTVIKCSVASRNVGSGTAFIQSMSINTRPDSGWPGALSNAIVPSGEGCRVTFSIPKDRPELGELLSAAQAGAFNIDLRYTDVNGGQETITRLDIQSNPVRVRQVYLFRPGDSEPFAASGPAGD